MRCACQSMAPFVRQRTDLSQKLQTVKEKRLLYPVTVVFLQVYRRQKDYHYQQNEYTSLCLQTFCLT